MLFCCPEVPHLCIDLLVGSISFRPTALRTSLASIIKKTKHGVRVKHHQDKMCPVLTSTTIDLVI